MCPTRGAYVLTTSMQTRIKKASPPFSGKDWESVSESAVDLLRGLLEPGA